MSFNAEQATEIIQEMRRKKRITDIRLHEQRVAATAEQRLTQKKSPLSFPAAGGVSGVVQGSFSVSASRPHQLASVQSLYVWR